MGLLSWWFLLLGAPAFLLGHCSGSSSHSIDFFYTGVSEPSQGLPQFMAVEFVDDQYLAYYDTTTKKALPRAPWTRKLEKDNPQYWDSYTKTTQSWEETFRTSLANLQDSYKHSGGLHTWQKMYGCHLSEDGQKGGYMRYGYDGRDFISFDKDTLTWTAVDAVAEKTKRKWDGMQTRTQDKKRYLEVTCINWLQKYLAYGNETLLRKEIPVVKVARKATGDGWDTLLCKAYGFYPKEITITWRKNEEKTFHGQVVPNSDGTYHAWISIQIDPMDRGHYWCSVEHASLPEPLLIPWKGSGSSSHSLRFFYTGVSEASRGLPEFMALELVDDQPTCYYDSSINRPLPHAQWMEKVENDNAQYWDSKSKSMENWEANFRRSLVNMRNDYNQSWGLHTWQHMSGCHLSEGGQKGGYMRYGYDGRDFISFDKDTLTWTAVDAVAEKTKRKWDGMQTMTQDHKRFLEVTCINWLQKYLAYGNETFLRKGCAVAEKTKRKWDGMQTMTQDKRLYLEVTCINWLQKYLAYGNETSLRKEIPVVRMARKAASDGREALICQAFGFYPKEIDITWRMDNVIWEHKTLRGDVIPNSDGTYYTWINTEIDAEHKDPYKCHVEHSSLPEPLDLSLWEEFDVTRSWQDISWITHTISPPATTWAPATTSPPATTWAPVTTSPTATTSPPGTTWAPATTSPPATTWAPVTTSPTATTSPPGTTWAPATTSPPATTWAPVTTSSTATTSPPGTTWAPATTSTPATTWAPATTSVPVTTHQMQSITLPLSIKSLLHQSVHPCRKDEAVCPNQQCIPRKLLCNGDRDCSDGSDELNCDPASKAVCLQGSIMATRTVILLGVGIYLIFVHIHK